MRIQEVIFLSLAVGFLIIGIHQIRAVGFGNAYWAIMLALAFFFLFNLKRRKPS